MEIILIRKFFKLLRHYHVLRKTDDYTEDEKILLGLFVRQGRLDANIAADTESLAKASEINCEAESIALNSNGLLYQTNEDEYNNEKLPDPNDYNEGLVLLKDAKCFNDIVVIVHQQLEKLSKSADDKELSKEASSLREGLMYILEEDETYINCRITELIDLLKKISNGEVVHASTLFDGYFIKDSTVVGAALPQIVALRKNSSLEFNAERLNSKITKQIYKFLETKNF